MRYKDEDGQVLPAIVSVTMDNASTFRPGGMLGAVWSDDHVHLTVFGPRFAGGSAVVINVPWAGELAGEQYDNQDPHSWAWPDLASEW